VPTQRGTATGCTDQSLRNTNSTVPPWAGRTSARRRPGRELEVRAAAGHVTKGRAGTWSRLAGANRVTRDRHDAPRRVSTLAGPGRAPRDQVSQRGSSRGTRQQRGVAPATTAANLARHDGLGCPAPAAGQPGHVVHARDAAADRGVTDSVAVEPRDRDCPRMPNVSVHDKVNSPARIRVTRSVPSVLGRPQCFARSWHEPRYGAAPPLVPVRGQISETRSAGA